MDPKKELVDDLLLLDDLDGYSETSEMANMYQTKYGSIPGAMYHVLMNFNGEFPLADHQQCFWSRIAAILSVFVGVGVLALPAGLIGNALEEEYSDIDEHNGSEQAVTESSDAGEATKRKR